MSDNKKPRIGIQKTVSEWQLIDNKITELRKSSFGSFLRSRISVLVKDYKKSRTEICNTLSDREKKQRRYIQINEDDLKILEVINTKTGISVTKIVDEIILSQLLNSDNDK